MVKATSYFINLNNYDKENMLKNDIKILLLAAALILFGYSLIYGVYYFADFLGIYEELKY
jgi:cell division protein FtsB